MVSRARLSARARLLWPVVWVFGMACSDAPEERRRSGPDYLPDTMAAVADAGRGPDLDRRIGPVGLDSAALAEIYRGAADLSRLHSLLIARHGDIYAERYFRGWDADDYANIKSASKSVLSALVGIAIAEGELEGLRQPIGGYFERELRPPADSAVARITLEDLLSMRSGLEPTSLARDPQGIYFGGNDMRMRPLAMLRFGEMYRNGGRWKGEQVVPEAWVRDSWTRRTTSPYNAHGYGLGWWMRRSGQHDVYFAWGYGGQFIFVVPSVELTVVMTSESETERAGSHLRALHAMVDRLIHAAERGGDARPIRQVAPVSRQP